MLKKMIEKEERDKGDEGEGRKMIQEYNIQIFDDGKVLCFERRVGEGSWIEADIKEVKDIVCKAI